MFIVFDKVVTMLYNCNYFQCIERHSNCGKIIIMVYINSSNSYDNNCIININENIIKQSVGAKG